MSSYEFESHEPVDLYVEIGKGSVIVTTIDTTRPPSRCRAARPSR